MATPGLFCDAETQIAECRHFCENKYYNSKYLYMYKQVSSISHQIYSIYKIKYSNLKAVLQYYVGLQKGIFSL